MKVELTPQLKRRIRLIMQKGESKFIQTLKDRLIKIHKDDNAN